MYYNIHHKSVNSQVGDKVLLQSINIRALRPKKKLDHRPLELFKIMQTIGTQAHRLKLPEKYGAIQPVFHVSLLRLWHSRGEDPELQATLVEGEKEWKVKRIIDKRIKKGKLEYSPFYEMQ